MRHQEETIDHTKAENAHSENIYIYIFERQIWITDGALEYHRATSRTTRSYPSPLDNAYTPIQKKNQ
ncbi:hypothetical protein Hanom_Chr00s056836g01783301 [Helianthus anomalus]